MFKIQRILSLLGSETSNCSQIVLKKFFTKKKNEIFMTYWKKNMDFRAQQIGFEYSQLYYSLVA